MLVSLSLNPHALDVIEACTIICLWLGRVLKSAVCQARGNSRFRKTNMRRRTPLVGVPLLLPR